ncbi:MAG: universal stress protein [Longimicrobiales bacterium]
MEKERKYTVLVPVSLPSAGPGLVRVAAALAHPGREPRICALHLEAGGKGPVPARIAKERAELREEALAGALGAGSSLGLDVRTRSFPSTDVPGDILETAREEAAELIVMGWTKPILGRSITSETVNALLAGATTDVAIFFSRRGPPWRRILLPFTGGPHDRLALEFVRAIVESGASATVLHVIDPDRSPTDAPRLRTAETGGFRDERVALKVVMSWDAVGEVVRESTAGYDLIVSGVASTWGVGAQPIGKHHERIARESDASLLLVRKHVPAEELTEGHTDRTDARVRDARSVAATAAVNDIRPSVVTSGGDAGSRNDTIIVT